MLILSRRADESIRIGDDVTVTVLGIKGKQVQLGIKAPSDVSVHREEVYQRIQEGQEPNPADPKRSEIDAAWNDRKAQVIS